MHPAPLLSRRDVLTRCGLGIGSLALADLLSSTGLFASDAATGSPLAARSPHFAPKAKRVLHIFPEGGPSHVDTFDPKPALDKYHGKLAQEVYADYIKNAPASATDMGRLSGKLQRSAFKFSKNGKSGTEVSELFPMLAKHVDDLCVVRSMFTKSSVHEPAQLLMSTGEATLVRPSMGSWVTYGLGTVNQNLPAFVGLAPSGTTASGEKHWSAAFLPGWTQGTGIATRNATAEKMLDNIRSGSTSLREQRRQLDLLKAMNGDFADRRGPGDDALDGRIQAFETAFRMQVEAQEAFDITREPQKVRDLYGDTEQGRQLLLARRLLERGVRYVQAWHTGWDTHDFNDESHRKLALAADQPLAALVTDLKRLGMLDDTLVLWAGEFGRTPTTDNNDVATKKSIGRDHNAGGFTVWMAGGGTKGGLVYGSTDEFGAIASQDRVEVHDLHATMLHLLGFDHTKLTYRHAGRDFRLTDVHGHVVKALLK
ncbi:protein containing duf1501 : Uncharacterized protein OS=Chthoniobacter flavus Ellin428 GN=CfE428DRAFT_6606 PE=4 SV=1: DUF1501 [Gemmataceae bacterium]|nr:protein containing duf1501 : Uncharacterized protein OS=Chthoniobacter flavus Ellin428 GN=CfE428DRAFT_6606 PE=4 SV=1: DUF1501 [Gemmataceae bacterium]VTT96418.1 protein containing duf1501 : Uncharacterized protein OS=Chthoniobacter flavus Ellin428 GN=CfE428DRAFT_6606 PE=4 SV=1: DUF1501 [Gemmataceae bacterium]